MNLRELFGEGNELTSLQMSLRAVVVFLIALVYLRVSGRRSFGMRSPFDNVISVLLGAVLSRAVTGSSPFVPVIIASLVIVLLHRFFAWISIYSDAFGRLIKGDAHVIYKDGVLFRENMHKSLITDKDLKEGLHDANIESLEQVKAIYVERGGNISVVKKEEQ